METLPVLRKRSSLTGGEILACRWRTISGTASEKLPSVKNYGLSASRND